ncbi:hypothetical protein GBAR_LOCUS16627 [Geodia barretti]|uniref:Uncharacterized protein n=1 Tax=Geodia barretti TaxID=519541 RepID=A0AA35SIK2_GEOBA|nr:hypothetical protein GBAR_LOCUS16627 [Geodia barretti]
MKRRWYTSSAITKVHKKVMPEQTAASQQELTWRRGNNSAQWKFMEFKQTKNHKNE